MQKNYTVKKKNLIHVSQPKVSVISTIINFSKTLEVLKGSKQNVELILN